MVGPRQVGTVGEVGTGWLPARKKVTSITGWRYADVFFWCQKMKINLEIKTGRATRGRNVEGFCQRGWL